LDTRRRAFLVGTVVALAVIGIILARLVMAPSYALLYSGLDPAAAGQVVAAIENQGVPYRVQGDSIYVDVTQRDALRMSLAGEGLPTNGAAGYELLDTLSGFGTTSQMFDAAYWRAKEGELARTILSSPRIRAARVHIANPGSNPFQPARDVTASVALRPAAGGLGPGHAQALRYLVASSVPGLLPENVTVIDADSGQVLGGTDQVSPAADATSRAEEYRRAIERLLAARVGEGNAVVQVNVELTTARETILERRIDPESRVMIATETEERSDSASDADSGAVTVASNLPDGDAAGGNGQSSSQTSESRERVTFDMSEMQREVEQGPGDIRRISVAVLLNGVETVDANGVVTIEPRSAQEIEALRGLVQSAIGYTAERGDAVTINSMAFDSGIAAELAAPTLADRLSVDVGRVIQTLVLAAAALFIAFGLVRPLLSRSQEGFEPEQPPRQVAFVEDMPAEDSESYAGATSLSGVASTGLPRPDSAADATGISGPATPLPMAAPVLSDAQEDDPLPDDPVERLRRLIEEREEETVEILRSWMDDEEVPS
jgi:flagellar M-ring protein FliF